MSDLTFLKGILTGSEITVQHSPALQYDLIYTYLKLRSAVNIYVQKSSATLALSNV